MQIKTFLRHVSVFNLYTPHHKKRLIRTPKSWYTLLKIIYGE